LHLSEQGGRRAPQADSPNTAWRNDAFRGYADHRLANDAFRGYADHRLANDAFRGYADHLPSHEFTVTVGS